MLVDHLIAVKCGKRGFHDVQNEVEKALANRFPSFKADGGGMYMDGRNVREIFMRIDHRSVKKVATYLKALGFKLEDK